MSYPKQPGATTRLSSKGQVVLPKSVRVAHQWDSGTELAVEDTARGVLLRSIKSFTPTTLEAVVGSTGYRGPSKSNAQMRAAITRGARARHGRG